MPKKIITTFIIGLQLVAINAQTTELIENFLNGDSVTNPSHFLEFNSRLYFAAQVAGTPFPTYNLWEYNTVEEPKFIGELNSEYSNIGKYWGMQPVIFKDQICFSGANKKLYAFDGVNPPVLIGGSEVNNVSHLHVFNDSLFFTATSAQTGYEVFCYDGVNPPGLWLDIVEGPEDSDPKFIISNPDTLFLLAGDTIYYHAGTNSLNKVYSASYHWVDELFIAADVLHFMASDGENYTIWKLMNGEEVVSMNTAGVEPDLSLLNYTVYKDQIYFRATSHSDFYGSLYRVTEQFMAEKVQISTAQTEENYGKQPINFHVFDGTLYFSAFSGGFAQSVFSYNGIDEPSVFMFDPTTIEMQNPENYFSFNNNLYFFALHVSEGYLLHKMVFHPQRKLAESACDSYAYHETSFNTTGNYKFFVPAMEGPDSIIHLDLIINYTPDASVSQTDSLLLAVEEGALYQWLTDNFQPIAGEDNREFIATQSGNYALLISREGCEDTSGLHEVLLWDDLISVSTNFEASLIKSYGIYNQELVIDLDPVSESIYLAIFSLTGKLIMADQFRDEKSYSVPLDLFSDGLYIVKVAGNNTHESFRFSVH